MAFKKVKKEDSFAQWFIDNFGKEKFSKCINHNKNIELGLDIWTISKRSLANIWFICENKKYHEYCLSADKYFKGNRCRYCGRTKYVHPLDSLGQLIKDTINEDVNLVWSSKNDKSPFKYTIGTEKKAWFKCKEGIHEDSYRQIKNVVASNFVCPFCSKNFNASVLQDKVFEYIKSAFKNVNREHNCSIIPINPKTGYPLPFDNEIVDIKLIIEVMGRQHYERMGDNSKWLHGMTPLQYLRDRKLKDRYKRIFAKHMGYNYLEIPYWTNNKEELWKKMIDDKINEIKREQRLRRDDLISDEDAIV